MTDKRILTELGIIATISFLLFFISTNVNPVLGGIYQGLAILGIVLTIIDVSYGKKEIFLINKSISWGKALVISLFAYVGLIFGSHLATGLAKAIPLTELLGLLGATAPIFSQSQSINFVIFAIIIPIIETYVIFGAAIDIFSSMFKISPTKKNLFSTKLMTIIIIISLAFLIFHTSAKGLENEAALILVGIMGFISCVLIIWFQEYRIAILLHLLANTIASVGLFV